MNYIQVVCIVVSFFFMQSSHAEWVRDVQIRYISHLDDGTIQVNLMNTVTCGVIGEQTYVHIIPNDVNHALETMHRGLLSAFLVGRSIDLEIGVSTSRADLCSIKRVLIR